MRAIRLSAAVAIAAAAMGCYTTRIETEAKGDDWYRDRQWFTLGGFVDLSDPAGRECDAGLSAAQSKLSGVDILINIGIAAAGGLIGAAACSDQSNEGRAACSSSGAGLAQFLLASRTVEYSCLAR